MIEREKILIKVDAVDRILSPAGVKDESVYSTSGSQLISPSRAEDDITSGNARDLIAAAATEDCYLAARPNISSRVRRRCSEIMGHVGNVGKREAPVTRTVGICRPERFRAFVQRHSAPSLRGATDRRARSLLHHRLGDISDGGN